MPDRANILVVDDNEAQLLALEAILEPLGQRVVRASSGEDALRALLRQEFAVILLDIAMKGMGGLETAELIKSRERDRLVPIIFLTGMDVRGEQAMSRAYSMGAVDYIYKPVQAEVLRSKVSVFVDLARHQRRMLIQEHRLRDSDRRKMELKHTRERLESEARHREELSRVNEELEKAIAARSRFFAAMSHELRTPINAALGYLSLIIEDVYGPLNDKQKEGVQKAERATKQLLELVNDVLDLSKIEAGKIDLAMENVSIPDLIQDIFVTAQPLADERGSVLTFNREGDMEMIESDPRRVRQILFNLLSNAIKFGEGKPIDVNARPRDAAEGGGVVVQVVDHGTGIAPEDQARIFEEFEQAEGEKRQAGTGLGLPISKRLAELLGGTLTLTSEVRQGATFTVTLPAKTETPHEQEGEKTPADRRAAA